MAHVVSLLQAALLWGAVGGGWSVPDFSCILGGKGGNTCHIGVGIVPRGAPCLVTCF
jgi:hypothetical protein